MVIDLSFWSLFIICITIIIITFNNKIEDIKTATLFKKKKYRLWTYYFN